MAILTEEDIKAGEIVSESGTLRRAVISGGGYTDLTELDASTLYDRYRYVETGTSREAVISDLPAEVKASDKEGRTYTLTGEWVSGNYNANEKGRYTLNSSRPIFPTKCRTDSGC